MGDVPPPRVEGFIALPGGRRLGFAEFGPAGGRPVLWFHGTPGARRQVAPVVREAAEQHGVRIITLERPGIGASTPHLYDRLVDWAADVEHVVDQLGIERFAVVGLSGGGPYVLACVHQMPDRVVSGAVLGGVAPTRGPDAAEGGPPALTARFGSLLYGLRHPLGSALGTMVRVLAPVASSGFDLVVKVFPESDRRVLSDPGNKAMFIDDLVRGNRRYFHAVMYDLVLFGRHWGFSPRDITVPVHFWHGDADSIVPVRHGEHMASIVPGADLQVRPGDSHLGNLTAAAEVFDSLLSHWPPDGDRHDTGNGQYGTDPPSATTT